METIQRICSFLSMSLLTMDGTGIYQSRQEQPVVNQDAIRLLPNPKTKNYEYRTNGYEKGADSQDCECLVV